jgi:intracellular septation protein
MKFLYDLFPVILFFIAFKLTDIYVATGVAIGATVLQIGLLAVLRRKIDPMLWVSFGIIAVFGGATLVLHDETFIKWKPTVLYWMFAAALAGSALLLRKNLIRSMLGKQLQLPEPAWSKLNWSWVAFFMFMGAVNLVIAFNFTTDQWVTYKLFGGTGLMLLFVIAQALFLARHVQEEEKPTQGEP